MKKVISLFLSVAMLLSIVSVVDFSAYASVKTGKCGDNVTYSLDTETGVLTISGTGKMTDYSYSLSPFCNDTKIKVVTIDYGVTSIGKYAFRSCKNLTSVTMPNSLTSPCAQSPRAGINDGNEKPSPIREGFLFENQSAGIHRMPADLMYALTCSGYTRRWQRRPSCRRPSP